MIFFYFLGGGCGLGEGGRGWECWQGVIFSVSGVSVAKDDVEEKKTFPGDRSTAKRERESPDRTALYKKSACGSTQTAASALAQAGERPGCANV